MLVTVVTPTFNAVTYLEECIRSVQAQAGEGVEVEHVIADGGSTDGTAELARSLGATVLQEPDEGLYDADNKGAAASSGELLGFLGADDLLLPGALAAVARRYEADRHPMLIGGVRWIDGGGKSLGHFRAPPHWMSSRMLADLGWCYIHQMATYVTRDLYNELGGFDISLTVSSDYDFFCKALAGVRPGAGCPNSWRASGVTARTCRCRHHARATTPRSSPGAMPRSRRSCATSTSGC